MDFVRTRINFNKLWKGSHFWNFPQKNRRCTSRLTVVGVKNGVNGPGSNSAREFTLFLEKAGNHLFAPTYGLNNSVSWVLQPSVADSLIEGKAWIQISRSEWQPFDYQHLFSHDGYVSTARESTVLPKGLWRVVMGVK